MALTGSQVLLHVDLELEFAFVYVPCMQRNIYACVYLWSICTCVYAVQEESHPSDDSLDISTMGPGPSKYPNKERPANKKESPQNEPDSGYDRSTPDTTSVDSEQPHESPPLELKPKICGGNLVLNVGENALFVSASGRHNIIVQQGHIESKSVTIMQQSTIATESHPPQPEEPTDKACFGGLSTTEQSGEQSNHLREIEQRNAEIEELKRENSKLKQQLEDEKRRRKTLRESYDQLERSAKQNEAAARSELEKKVKELEECQSTISTMEKTHEEKCTKLQTDIDDLKKKIEEKNRSTQHEKMELKTRLCETETALHKTEKLLAEKENDVLKKEIEIKDLEMVILQKENKELKKKLGRKHQKCESMCTELSSPLSTLKIDEDSSFSD